MIYSPPMLFEKQMDNDTLICGISDLQNQAVTMPQRLGFFEAVAGRAI